MVENVLLSLVAIGTVGTIGRKLYQAACYGIKRFLEPYFIAHETKVAAKTELTIFRQNPLKQLEFAQEFMKNSDGRFPTEAVEEMKNICNVIKTAVGCVEGAQMGETIYTEEEDKEWFARFFDEARYISYAELQIVWGRLLAERMIHPEGINNRVLYFIRDLDKMEIETIRRSMRVFLNNSFVPDCVVNDFEGMSHDIPKLLSLRIIFRSGDPFHPLVFAFDLPEESNIEGNGYNFKINALEGKKKVEIQCYGLTPEGQVLSRLCESRLSRSEAQIICDRLNSYWKDEATVEIIEDDGQG